MSCGSVRPYSLRVMSWSRNCPQVPHSMVSLNSFGITLLFYNLATVSLKNRVLGKLLKGWLLPSAYLGADILLRLVNDLPH